MKLHHRGRLYQISQKMRIVFLDKLYDYRAGRRDHYSRLFLFRKKCSVLRNHQACTFCCIRCICKSQFLHRFPYSIDTGYPKTCQICRMKRGYNLRLILHCIADCRNHILLFLGILRADKDTLLTVNTLTFYDPGLMIMNTYRLDRAVPDTFVTIFTTDFFKLKD